MQRIMILIALQVKILQHKSINDKLCNVNIKQQLIECTTEPYNETVPTGTICTYEAANSFHTDTLLCYEGLSVFIEHKRKGKIIYTA